MVRFSLTRPFFRRKHSQPTTLRSDTTSVASNTAPSTRSADPNPLARRIRRFSSASLDHNNKPPRSRRNDRLDHPEPVPEQRESLLLLSNEDDKSPQVSTDDLPTPSDLAARSGSDTLAGEGDRKPEHFSLDTSVTTPSTTADEPKRDTDGEPINHAPALVLQEPTPGAEEAVAPVSFPQQDEAAAPSQQPQPCPEEQAETKVALADPPRRSSSQVSPGDTSAAAEAEERRQSIANSSNAKIVKTLVEAPVKKDPLQIDTNDSAPLPSAVLDYFTPGLPNMSNMLHRKIWVKRPGASATLVQIREDDLVDDVRDMILKKYANSLGKTFDAPDMLLRIVSRGDNGQPRTDRVLGPEELMCHTIDSHFPGGQTVDDALVIDVPPKRTPRPSPRMYQYPAYQAMEDHRPVESGTDYFPPMPAIVHPTMPMTSVSHDSRNSNHTDHQRSISVLSTGQVPPLPSPGGTRRHREHRPKFNRQHTSSPTIVQHNSNAGAVAVVSSGGNLVPQQPTHHSHRGSLRPRTESNASERPRPLMPNGAPAPAPMPTPPVAENAATGSNPPTPSTSQTAQAPRTSRPKKNGRKPTPDKPGVKSRRDRSGTSDSPQSSLISNMLDGSIPPINVLIVEDNIINMRILEGLMKRLKVRWETAMNGQIAVDKWRAGGFHLVLMDIQMPVMNGLAATKEIRRLEKANGIGVFSSSAPSSPIEHRTSNKQNGDSGAEPNGDEDKDAAAKRKKSADKLPEATGGLFKSPIIIVALTASSLQSDRHEALAAGCNDFLTKPVNFVWLERKVKEWGCMQALIDFDGWRRWKDYASKEEEGKSEEQKRKEKEDEEKQKRKMEKLAILQERQKAKKEADEAKKRAEREKAEQEQQDSGEKEKDEEQADSVAAPTPAPASSDDVADKADDENSDTSAEVSKEKEEIDQGDVPPEAQEGENPNVDAEPPALAPETIEGEVK